MREVIDDSDAPSHTRYPEIKVIFVVPRLVNVIHDHLPRSSDPFVRNLEAHLSCTEIAVPPGW